MKPDALHGDDRTDGQDDMSSYPAPHPGALPATSATLGIGPCVPLAVAHAATPCFFCGATHCAAVAEKRLCLKARDHKGGQRAIFAKKKFGFLPHCV